MTSLYGQKITEAFLKYSIFCIKFLTTWGWQFWQNMLISPEGVVNWQEKLSFCSSSFFSWRRCHQLSAVSRHLATERCLMHDGPLLKDLCSCEHACAHTPLVSHGAAWCFSISRGAGFKAAWVRLGWSACCNLWLLSNGLRVTWWSGKLHDWPDHKAV